MQMSFQDVLLSPRILRCPQGRPISRFRSNGERLVPPPQHFHLQFTSKRLEKSLLKGSGGVQESAQVTSMSSKWEEADPPKKVGI